MAAEDTTTVRVRRPDSERLQALATQRHTTVIEMVHSAIGALERREFQRGLNDDYRQLREDSELWVAYARGT
jgi:predicted transcriptional regulator